MRSVLIFLIIVPSFLFSKPDAIGNHLAPFFHSLLRQSSQGKALRSNPLLNTGSEPEILSFYQKFPLKVELTDQEKQILNSLPPKVWKISWPFCTLEWDSDIIPYYLDYHIVLRSVCRRVMRDIFNQMNLKIEVNFPVIHYRLGDVPFCRHNCYHLNKYSFYLWALEQFEFEDENRSVILVYSENHLSNLSEKEACRKYIEGLKSFLNQHNYHVILQSESILYDFINMVCAPMLISGASSYSFMAGMANQGVFLSSKFGKEVNGNYIFKPESDWIYPISPLLHYEVLDYLDVDRVIQQLYN